MAQEVELDPVINSCIPRCPWCDMWKVLDFYWPLVCLQVANFVRFLGIKKFQANCS
jgi:hypothetical protein